MYNILIKGNFILSFNEPRKQCNKKTKLERCLIIRKLQLILTSP